MTHTKDVQEIIILKGKLKVIEKTIQNLNKTIDDYRLEAKDLHSKLPVNESLHSQPAFYFNKQRGGLMRLVSKSVNL